MGAPSAARTSRLAGVMAFLLASCLVPASRAVETSPVTSIQMPPIDKSVPAALRNAVGRAIVDGSLLYRNDTASAVASDAMVASGVLKDGLIRPTGWLTKSLDVAGDDWSVLFTESLNHKPHDFADASVKFINGKPVVTFHRNQPSTPITGMDAVLIHARDLAAHGKFLHCADRYNQAVSLIQRNGSLLIVVDLMPARTEVTQYPMGGFQEFTYVVSGNAKPSEFSQTRTCLNQSFDPATKLAALVVTDITTPAPTNFHVFMSLSYGKPVFVLTTANHLMWKVDGNSIRVVKR